MVERTILNALGALLLLLAIVGAPVLLWAILPRSSDSVLLLGLAGIGLITWLMGLYALLTNTPQE